MERGATRRFYLSSIYYKEPALGPRIGIIEVKWVGLRHSYYRVPRWIFHLVRERDSFSGLDWVAISGTRRIAS